MYTKKNMRPKDTLKFVFFYIMLEKNNGFLNLVEALKVFFLKHLFFSDSTSIVNLSGINIENLSNFLRVCKYGCI